MDTITQKITAARLASGKSQSELARALNIKPQAVQKWESGGTPRNARMPEVAQALGVSVAYLLGEVGLEPVRGQNLLAFLSLCSHQTPAWGRAASNLPRMCCWAKLC